MAFLKNFHLFSLSVTTVFKTSTIGGLFVVFRLCLRENDDVFQADKGKLPCCRVKEDFNCPLNCSGAFFSSNGILVNLDSGCRGVMAVLSRWRSYIFLER